MTKKRRALNGLALLLAVCGSLTLVGKSYAEIVMNPQTGCADYSCHQGGSGDIACQSHMCDNCAADSRCALVAR